MKLPGIFLLTSWETEGMISIQSFRAHCNNGFDMRATSKGSGLATFAFGDAADVNGVGDTDRTVLTCFNNGIDHASKYVLHQSHIH